MIVCSLSAFLNLCARVSWNQPLATVSWGLLPGTVVVVPALPQWHVALMHFANRGLYVGAG